MSVSFEELMQDIRGCRICEAVLPCEPNPVFRAGQGARLLIVGQAPGRRVHQTSIPFNDPSGDRLRAWLNMERETFYDTARIAILPMGFCYPGTGKSGDLPPRKECALAWREKLLAAMPEIRLTLVIGQYAQKYHLGSECRPTLTETVMSWQDYAPRYFPLPHPSPRNNLWLKRNPWFAERVIPSLRESVAELLSSEE